MGQLEKPYKNIGNVDLFLMASKYEGMPTSLIEATMLGIPIVATNVPGGIAEVVENGVNGFLVDNDSEIGFANTIKKALQYNFNRKIIAESAAEKFNSSYALKKTEQLFITAATNN
jgi:glycosyltransferase involved in cell wall biosynthesis